MLLVILEYLQNILKLCFIQDLGAVPIRKPDISSHNAMLLTLENDTGAVYGLDTSQVSINNIIEYMRLPFHSNLIY